MCSLLIPWNPPTLFFPLFFLQEYLSHLAFMMKLPKYRLFNSDHLSFGCDAITCLFFCMGHPKFGFMTYFVIFRCSVVYLWYGRIMGGKGLRSIWKTRPHCNKRETQFANACPAAKQCTRLKLSTNRRGTADQTHWLIRVVIDN